MKLGRSAPQALVICAAVSIVTLLTPGGLRAAGCSSAGATMICATQDLDPAQFPTPIDGIEPFDSCVPCELRGSFKGSLTLCSRATDGFADPWQDGGSGGFQSTPLMFKATAFIETTHGTILAFERGSLLASAAFPESHYWASVLEVVGGTGRYAGAFGVVLAHNLWNQPFKAKTEGEICTR